MRCALCLPAFPLAHCEEKDMQTIGDYFLDGAIAAALIFLLVIGYATLRENMPATRD